MKELFSKKIKPRKPLGDEIYQAVKSAILTGRLMPGERLVEAQLAETLGASRTPVRQAIHMLARENLVERRGKRGFFVLGLSETDVAEIIDIRSVLESFAARLAAEKAGESDISRLTDLNEAFGEAIGRVDAEKLAELNTAFHEELYKQAGNRRLYEMIRNLHDHLYRYRIVLLKTGQLAETSYEDHRAMIGAMAHGNPEGAERLVREHILKGKSAMAELIRALDTAEN